MSTVSDGLQTGFYGPQVVQRIMGSFLVVFDHPAMDRITNGGDGFRGADKVYIGLLAFLM